MQLRRYMGQRGDTIVEVLIAIAVAGSILGTSYAIIGRNAKSYQQVSEHTEALKLAEGQLENIRKAAAGTDDSLKDAIFLPASGSTFCTEVILDQVTVKSTPCSTGRYTITVNRSGSNTFETVVVWDGINGGDDKVSLNYKVDR